MMRWVLRLSSGAETRRLKIAVIGAQPQMGRVERSGVAWVVVLGYVWGSGSRYEASVLGRVLFWTLSYLFGCACVCYRLVLLATLNICVYILRPRIRTYFDLCYPKALRRGGSQILFNSSCVRYSVWSISSGTTSSRIFKNTSKTMLATTIKSTF